MQRSSDQPIGRARISVGSRQAKQIAKKNDGMILATTLPARVTEQARHSERSSRRDTDVTVRLWMRAQYSAKNVDGANRLPDRDAPGRTLHAPISVGCEGGSSQGAQSAQRQRSTEGWHPRYVFTESSSRSDELYESIQHWKGQPLQFVDDAG